MRRDLGLALYAAAMAAAAVLVDWPRAVTAPGPGDLAVHMATALAMSVAGVLFFKGIHTRPAVALLLGHILLPVFLPVFFLFFMLTMRCTRKADLLGGFHEEDGRIAKTMADQAARAAGVDQGLLQEKLNVEPVVETIRGAASAELKRGAIETLANLGTPQAVSLLKECLHDADAEVRFYASSGLSRIEERLNARVVALKKRLSAGEEGLTLLSGLGAAYYEFVYLQIQDVASLGYYMGQAVHFLERAAAHPAAGEEQRGALRRAYVAAGMYDKLDAIAASSPEAPASATVGDIMYTAETYFRRGRFKECRRMVALSRERGMAWPVIRDVQELWLGPAREKS